MSEIYCFMKRMAGGISSSKFEVVFFLLGGFE